MLFGDIFPVVGYTREIEVDPEKVIIDFRIIYVKAGKIYQTKTVRSIDFFALGGKVYFYCHEVWKMTGGVKEIAE
jgi:hypothetical protein